MSKFYKISSHWAMMILALCISHYCLAAPTSCPDIASQHDTKAWTSDGLTVSGPFLHAVIMNSAQSVYCFYGVEGAPVNPYLRSNNFIAKAPAAGKWIKINCKIDTPCYKCST